MSFRTGDVIGDRYELGAQLGAGGMARVYLAHDRLLDREVAVKVLAEPYASDPQFVERFRREASAAAGLNHPNIVAVYDRGEADGSYYIVMEYLPGPDLKQVIREEAPLPPLRAVDYALQILAAMGAAHRRDVVHRDVKPQNVMVSEDGHLKVTDFGIARAGAQSQMTEAGSVIGTAQYLSPEQARGDEVTAASDCYSVGIVLYEMLTGRVPFDAERPVAVAMKQINDPPTPPSDIVATIPHALEGVVLHSLAKRPGERYRTAEDFSRALLDVRADLEGGTAATRMLPVAPGAAEATAVMAAASEPTAATRVQPGRGVPPPGPEPRRRRRWPWIAGGILIVLLLALGAFALMSGGGDTRQVTIPDVSGQPVAQAQATLEELGLQVQVRGEANEDVPRGSVIRTSPPAGSSVDEGSTVTLLVSGGPGQAVVPDVVGQDATAASAEIIRAGFQVDVTEQASDSVPVDRVIRQNPAGGTEAERGSVVTLVVSTGPEEVEVPALSGLTQQEARNRLEESDLTLGGVSTRESDQAAPGRVIQQNPGAGTRVGRGSSVSIVLAVAPEPDTIAVPNVVGNFRNDAITKLSQLGFTVVPNEVTSVEPPGVVIRQTPAAGAEVERGSQIVITVSTGPGETQPTTPTEPTTPTTPTTPADQGGQPPVELP
jgi:eukaryotic-like serine/threonine-protein kinase